MARLRKKGRSSKPFNPYQSPYKTQGQFDRAVNQEAGRGYQPQLGDLRSQGSAENRKHATRGGEIESLYNSYGNELQRAFDQTTGALNNLVSQSQGASAADQAALRAALGAGQSQQADLAQKVGGSGSGVPSNAGSTATLLPAWGTAEANRTALGSSVAAQIAEAAQRRSLPALGKIRSSETESRRHFGEQDRLSQARQNVLSQVPGLRLQARKALLGDAREGQNVAFQQNLAAKQFGLDVRKQGAAEQAQKHQELMDSANLDLQQQQLQAQVDAATTTEDAAAADARSKAFANGVSYVKSSIAPGKTDRNKKGKLRKEYKARFSDPKNFTEPSQLWHDLRTQFGLSDHDASVILNSIHMPVFKNWVKRHRQGPKKNPPPWKPKTKMGGGQWVTK